MAQRGRRSSAALSVPPIDGSPPRLVPPLSLSLEEHAIFNELVDAVDRRPFRKSDLPLVCAYTRAIRFESFAAGELAQDPTNSKMLALWEKSSRAIVALSAKLRLNPQSRQHARTTQRLPPPGPRPWDVVRSE